MSNANDKRLFWACFTALIATAFGFVVRTQIMDTWGEQFNLNKTELGQIQGAWLWPFAISIVLFSLIVDRIGYGRAMVFAFIGHVAACVIALAVPSVVAGQDSESARRTAYWMFYLSNFIGALGNGTVEAVINPVVATMFSKEKTKWLNILHAGWPGGLVLGGVLAILLTSAGFLNWQYKVGLVFIPIVLYAILMMGCKFPINERVAAGVPYMDMLKEAGVLSAMIVIGLMVREVCTQFGIATLVQILIFAGLAGAYGLWVRSIGRPMFVFLVIVMIPLAITELGTDSWITSLMSGEMSKNGLNPGWVLVYTSFIMMVLRFQAGAIVHRISPLGLLAVSAAIAAIGLVSLSSAAGILILAAATLYGFGKTFFWPTMLGVVSEQFPKGGALTLNMIAGIGMLGVGIIGSPLLGNIQDKTIDSLLRTEHPQLLTRAEGQEKTSVFGDYRSLDEDKVKSLPPADSTIIKEVTATAQKSALLTVAIFPCFMLVSYLILIAYFRARGGYKAQVLTGHEAKDLEFTGGVEAPVEA
jgi:MFS family permease